MGLVQANPAWATSSTKPRGRPGAQWNQAWVLGLDFIEPSLVRTMIQPYPVGFGQAVEPNLDCFGLSSSLALNKPRPVQACYDQT